MKKVLLVSNEFPPLWGGGVRRAFSLAKYWPQFALEPHVLTLKEKYYNLALGENKEKLNELPENVRIYRTDRSLSPYAKKIERGGVDAERRTEEDRTTKLKHLIKSLILIPDQEIRWKGEAVAEGLRIIQEQNIDIIFSTSPFATNHLVGQELARKSGLPWVADFRDLWSNWEKIPRTGIHQWLNSRLEHAVLQKADMVVSVAPFFINDSLEKYKDLSRSKFRLIRNGYDPTDIIRAKRAGGGQPNEKLTIAYLGPLQGRQTNPLNIFKALTRTLQANPGMRKNINFQVYGQVDLDYQHAARKMGLSEEIIKFHGARPVIEAMAGNMKADAALLFYKNRAISGKFYEYLAMGKTMLAVIPPGPAVDFAREYKPDTIFADPRDIDQIQEAINSLYQRWQQGAVHDQAPVKDISQFSWVAIAEKLAKLFEEILQSR